MCIFFSIRLDCCLINVHTGLFQCIGHWICSNVHLLCISHPVCDCGCWRALSTKWYSVEEKKHTHSCTIYYLSIYHSTLFSFDAFFLLFFSFISTYYVHASLRWFIMCFDESILFAVCVCHIKNTHCICDSIHNENVNIVILCSDSKQNASVHDRMLERKKKYQEEIFFSRYKDAIALNKVQLRLTIVWL